MNEKSGLVDEGGGLGAVCGRGAFLLTCLALFGDHLLVCGVVIDLDLLQGQLAFWIVNEPCLTSGALLPSSS